MDLAKNLVCSVTRGFYSTEHTLIIDALVLHSTLRDDELAYVMGQQTKHVRKLCGKLKEDGLLAVHSRLEQREGAQRPFSRDYYYIDYHRSIDVIKFRLKSMSMEVERRFGQTIEEKREYYCPRCGSEYTQLEVLDSTGANFEFVCRKCGHELRTKSDEELNGMANVGHEVQSRLNKQLGPFEALLQQIDAITVPENDFEAALSNRLEIQRSEINPAAKTSVVNGGGANAPAATVRGLKMEPDKIQISILEDEQATQEEIEAEKQRKAKLAAQNALPVWHTNSTVTGQLTTLGQTADTDANLLSASLKTEGDGDKKGEMLADSSELAAFFAELNQEQERMRAQSSDQSESSDGSDDDDEVDFEDVGFDDGDDAASTPPAAKRVRIDAPVTESSPGSEAKSTPLAAPLEAEPAPKVNGDAKRDDDESEEADEFEDAL